VIEEAEGTIQTYVCRLQPDAVLRVSNVDFTRTVRCAESLARIGTALTRGVPHEQVWCVMLDAKNELIGVIRLAEGGLHGCALRPSDVLRPVLCAGASAFALIHNHPGGDPTPSEADRAMTRSIQDAAVTVGLIFLDHVVVTRNVGKWHSMGASGDD
jgi:DNA repair protein RadC